MNKPGLEEGDCRISKPHRSKKAVKEEYDNELAEMVVPKIKCELVKVAAQKIETAEES